MRVAPAFVNVGFLSLAGTSQVKPQRGQTVGLGLQLRLQMFLVGPIKGPEYYRLLREHLGEEFRFWVWMEVKQE